MDNNRNTESEERSNVSYLGDEELLNLFERYVEYIRVTLGVYSRVFQGMEIEDRIEFRVGKPAEQYGRYAISVSYRGQDLGMPVSGTGLRRTTTSHTRYWELSIRFLSQKMLRLASPSTSKTFSVSELKPGRKSNRILRHLAMSIEVWAACEK